MIGSVRIDGAYDPHQNQIHPSYYQFQAGMDYQSKEAGWSGGEIIETFELKYNSVVSIALAFWAIEDSLQTTYSTTPCLSNHFLSLNHYD